MGRSAEGVQHALSGRGRRMLTHSTEPRPRTAVIAGATGNAGCAAATALARRGFRVFMLGRSKKRLEDRARSAGAGLRKNDPAFAGKLVPLEVDLTNLGSLREAAGVIKERFGTVDVLILSVVTYTQDGPTTLPDGNELMFSAHVLGQFRLAALLRPSLEAVQGIIVHLVAPFQRDVDWDDLQGKRCRKSMAAYERTKTCHRIMAGEMSRRYGGKVVSVAFGPGFVIDLNDPDLRNRWPSGPTGWFWRVYAAVAAKPPSGAGDAIAELVTRSSDREQRNGAYFRRTRRREKPDPSMNDPEQGARLWTALESLAFPDAGKAGQP